MPLLLWTDRAFNFDFDARIYPDILERFRGTPARLDDKLRGLPRDVLAANDGGWTILQNLGHLLDLEPLWDRRLDDYLAGRPVLSAADITNAATNQASHNARDVRDLLAAFRAHRAAQAARLDALPQTDFSRTAIHPRLKVTMRLVDAVSFVCQHDDYHMARMTELARKFG
jgi:uncharacterized damage-inducible protein DinB